ncbi:hypothetical protein [Aeromonas hydrophila]|uniref:hypothetical protein n=1 Tax=Aeromonas hydrophila TaxID=644 RepID=UPI003D19C2EB
MRLTAAIMLALLSGCASNNVVNVDGAGKWKYATDINGVKGMKMAALPSEGAMVGGVISVVRMPPEAREVDLIETKVMVEGESRIVFAAQFPKVGECQPMLNFNGDDYSPEVTDAEGVCRYVIDDARATHIAERMLEPGTVKVNGVSFETAGFHRLWQML